MVVQMRRTGARPLLKMVGNKPHASAEDHEEELGLDKAEDFNADPVSPADSDSEPEDDIVSSYQNGKTRKPGQFPGATTASNKRRSSSIEQLDGTEDTRPGKKFKSSAATTFQTKRPSKPVKTFKKASTAPTSETKIDDDWQELETQKPRSQRKTFQSGTTTSVYSKSTKKTPTFTTPASVPTISRKDSSKTLKSPLPTPRSSGRSNGKNESESDEENELDGIEQAVDLDLEEAVYPHKPKVNRKTSGKNFQDPISLHSSPRSSAPQFKSAETAEQAKERLKDETFEEPETDLTQFAMTQLPEEGPCPMHCGKMLSRTTLEMLDPRANIRQQQAFCRRHRVADAQEEWELRDYPNINWTTFKDRLEGYAGDITDMIKRPEKLFYRAEMEKRVKKGNDRTILQHMKNEGLESVGVGYYGPKGLDLIIHYITAKWNRVIRELVVTDKLVASRGAPGYIQMVLAPEVATLLVKEDMQVDAARARKIMGESNEIGELLHGSDERTKARGRREVVHDD